MKSFIACMFSRSGNCLVTLSVFRDIWISVDPAKLTNREFSADLSSGSPRNTLLGGFGARGCACYGCRSSLNSAG
jgi:hypothetical protein